MLEIRRRAVYEKYSIGCLALTVVSAGRLQRATPGLEGTTRDMVGKMGLGEVTAQLRRELERTDEELEKAIGLAKEDLPEWLATFVKAADYGVYVPLPPPPLWRCPDFLRSRKREENEKYLVSRGMINDDYQLRLKTPGKPSAKEKKIAQFYINMSNRRLRYAAIEVGGGRRAIC